MKEIGELGLTLKQTLEMSTYEPALVNAWLEHVDDPEIPNPTAFFLVGVRSGMAPGSFSDQRREKAIHLCERWIVNAGVFVQAEDELLRELFEGSGRLRAWADDELLRRRMVARWREERPRGEEAEREAVERARRIRESRASA